MLSKSNMERINQAPVRVSSTDTPSSSSRRRSVGSNNSWSATQTAMFGRNMQQEQRGHRIYILFLPSSDISSRFIRKDLEKGFFALFSRAFVYLIPRSLKVESGCSRIRANFSFASKSPFPFWGKNPVVSIRDFLMLTNRQILFGTIRNSYFLWISHGCRSE